MKKLVCKMVGHQWTRWSDTPVPSRECVRCSRTELMGVMRVEDLPRPLPRQTYEPAPGSHRPRSPPPNIPMPPGGTGAVRPPSRWEPVNQQRHWQESIEQRAHEHFVQPDPMMTAVQAVALAEALTPEPSSPAPIEHAPAPACYEPAPVCEAPPVDTCSSYDSVSESSSSFDSCSFDSSSSGGGFDP